MRVEWLRQGKEKHSQAHLLLSALSSEGLSRLFFNSAIHRFIDVKAKRDLYDYLV